MTTEPPRQPRFAPGNGIGGVFSLVILATIVAAGLIYGALRWIDSDDGRAFLVRQLPRIETEIGLGISADRIDGSIFGVATIHGLKLSDPKGVFAEIPRVDVDWRPLDLIGKTFTAKRLTTPELRLLRLPALNPSSSPTFFPDFDFAIARFRIDRLVLEAPVAGSLRVLAVGGNADIRKGRALIDVTALTLGETARGQGDTLRLKLDAEPDADRFDIDGIIVAPSGGALVALLGLPAPLDARLTGDGSWSKWAGRFDAKLGGKPLAAIAITGNSGRFTANGTATPGTLLSGPAAALLAPALAIDASAAITDGKADISGVFSSGAIDLRVRGGVNLGAESLDNMTVQARLLKPGAVNPQFVGRDVALTARLAGTIRRPIVDYRLSAASLGWGTMIANDVRAAGIVNLGKTPLTLPIVASASRITGVPDTAIPFLTNVRIDGAIGFANSRLTANNLRFASDRVSGTATLVAVPATGSFVLNTSAAVPRLAVPGVGIADINVDLRVASGAGGPGISGPVRIRVTRLDNAAIAGLTEGLPTLTANVAIAGDRSVAVTNAHLLSPGLTINGNGSLSANGVLRLAADGTSKAYGAFTIAAAGAVASPVIDVTFASPGLGIGLADVTARISGGDDGWRFSADGQTSYGAISGAGVVRTGTPLIIDVKKLTLAGLTGAGTLTRTAAGPFTGQIDISGRGLVGTVRLSSADAVQRAEILINANGAEFELATPVTIKAGEIRLNLMLPASGPTVKGSFDLIDIRRGGLVISRAAGAIDFANGNGRATASAKGTLDFPFDSKLDVDFDPDRIVIAASGTVDGRPIALSSPAVIDRTATGWTLTPVTIITPDGKMTLSGEFGERKAIKATFDKVSLAFLTIAWPSFDVSGRVSGNVDLAVGNDGVPIGNASLRINALSRATVAAVSAPIDIGINAALDARATTARAVIVRAGKIEGRAQMRIGPIAPGDEPLIERVFASPVFAQLRYLGPAEAIWGLTGIAGVDVRGPLAISADVNGILGNPQLTGTARSEGARVEVTALGSVIDKASLDARFTASRLELVRFGGQVGRNGSISGTGGIDLAADRGFPMDIRLTMKNAQLVKRDDLTATASGNVRIATDEFGGVVSGKLKIDEARYQLGRATVANVPVLPVTEINTHVLGRRVVLYAPPTRWLLSLQVDADRRLFVAGMGLESEWRADLKVRGAATAPELVGRVELVRGDYDFAGKRFTLTRGDLRFQGVFPPDPVINVSATTTANGINAQLDISGTAQRPAIAFSSVPALPEDEILSRLLFGESVTNLSAPEALQLAAALNSLRGGGGLNPINSIRKGLGIDRLRILPADATTGRGTSVAAGQYIGRNVYVELATDAQGYTATRIEVSLTRSLSILSEVATLGGTSASIRWKRDY